MVWTILALTLWVVLGGFISYYGDLQGRRWGKRRVSWFGMRPKHTAILITSLTGGVIAILSIITVMLIAQPVRDVVLRGETAIRDNKRLIDQQKRQQVTYNEEIARYQKQRDDTKALVTAGNLELTKLRGQLAKTESQLAALEKTMLGLHVAIGGLQSEKHKLQLVNHNLTHQNAVLAGDNRSAITLNGDLGKQNEQLSHDNYSLTKDKEALEAANLALKNANDVVKRLMELSRKQADTDYTTSRNLELERTKLEAQVVEIKHDRDEALGLIAQRDQLNAQIQSLNQLYAQKYAVLRQGRVGLRAGVELSRQLMPAHLAPATIKSQILNLLSSASERANAFGSAPDSDGRTAKLLAQKRVTLTGYVDITEDSQIEDLAQRWAEQDVNCVVVVTTVTNCLAGEPAYVELTSYPVVRVFKKGAEVASKVIDGHSSLDKIIDDLLVFLHKDVKEAAILAGTIPKVDPETGVNEVGILGTGDLFRLTERVRRMHGPVRLSARARQDLSSADTLNLTFRVDRLPAPVSASVFP